MAAEVLARVQAFSKKADELADKGHILRAAENYGRGAEAARALGEDNLVMVNQQLRQSNMLCIFISAAPDTAGDRHIVAPQRAECVALLSSTVVALNRRRVAGTLLEGKCATAEVAWRSN